MESPASVPIAGGIFLLPILCLGLPGCSPKGMEPALEGASAPAPRAVATVGMLADVVENVAGDRMKVVQIIPSGIDPHLYSPTRSAVLEVERADILFFNGLMLEGKMASVLQSRAAKGGPVWPVADRILESGRYPVIHAGQQHDPHLWTDVKGWMEATRVVAEALSRFDPGHAEDYQEASRRYLQELERLDEYARSAIASIPVSQRLLITAHDAFGYLGRAYGLEVRGIQGLSTESEAGIRDIEELVRLLVDRRIPAVFVESSISGQNVKALLEGARFQGHRLEIGGVLYSDAMGEEGSYQGTYIGMMDHNLTTIARALGGTVPPGGMQGLLPDPSP